jgi:hypothetical protein
VQGGRFTTTLPRNTGESPSPTGERRLCRSLLGLRDGLVVALAAPADASALTSGDEPIQRVRRGAVRRLAPIAVAGSIVIPAAAPAAFSAPEEVAPPSPSHRAFAAASDASGRLTVATLAGRRPRLLERVPGGRWSELPPPSGIAPTVFQTSLAAAGDGALAVAWQFPLGTSVRSFIIRAAVRDPGGTLSDPIEIAGAEAAGAQRPAVAIDAAGDVLLAYNTGTSASHLGLQGAIAIAYRAAGRARFSRPIIVDRTLSNPPVVALARDGTGIVAWTRRRELMAVTVGRLGAVGVAKRIARRVSGNRPVVAAGPRSAASVGYRIGTTEIRGRRSVHRTSVRVFARPAGATFGHAQLVFRGSGGGDDLALAADEEGRATLAWTESTLDRRVLGRVMTAAGRVGRRFRRARVVQPLGDESNLGPVSLAARHGHVALAWSIAKPDNRRGVRVAAGRWSERLKPQLILAAPRRPGQTPVGVGRVRVTVAADGKASAFWTTLRFPCESCLGEADQLLVSDGP